MKESPRNLRPEIRPSNIALLERLQQVTGRAVTDLVNEAIVSFYAQIRDQQLREAAERQAAYEAEHPEGAVDLHALQGL